MRRLLLVPALALVLLGTPVLALQVPTPPGAAVQDVPLASEQAVDPGWQSPETPVDSSLVGITWQGDPAATFTVEARASDGTWSAAPSLDASDVAPDAGTQDAAPAAEAASTGEHATEPVWIGDDATAVRVTVDGGTATDVSVAAVVDSGGTTPAGAAGALAGVVGPLDGTDRWLYGGALMALVALLVALALGLATDAPICAGESGSRCSGSARSSWPRAFRWPRRRRPRARPTRAAVVAAAAVAAAGRRRSRASSVARSGARRGSPAATRSTRRRSSSRWCTTR